MAALRMIDTFSGIGGFSLAARWLGGIETVQFVEREPFCQRILAKHWPTVPIHDDICTFQPEPNSADIVCGGFPCQDISQAGKGAGLAGSRSGLFYELLRVVRLVGPRYIVLENVAAITYRGMDDVLGALAEAGYDAEWACIPAAAVGACHQRDRWWCVAYASGADGGRRPKGAGRRQRGPADADGCRFPEGGRGAEQSSYAQGRAGHALPPPEPRGDWAPSKQAGRFHSNAANPAHMLSHVGPGQQQGQSGGRALPESGDGDWADAADPERRLVQRRGSPGFVAGEAGAGEADRQKRQRDGDAAQHCGATPDPMRQRLEGPDELGSSGAPWPSAIARLSPDWRGYLSQPVLCRGDDGLSGRVDRLKALGNAVVPQVAMVPLARVLELAGSMGGW